MGIFGSMFPGVTGFNPAWEGPLMQMFMGAPPNVNSWFMKQGPAMMGAKGPFQQVMGGAFAKAPPEVQDWARGYASAHHMDWLGLGAAPAAAPATRGFVTAAPAAPMSSAAGRPAPLGATPGHNPDIRHVDPRLLDIMAGGAAGLPAGYRVTINEGYNPNGHVPKSQHHALGRGALDVQIWTPDGKAIPNEGSDPTGMYHALAKSAYGYMLQAHPDLKGQFASGIAFGTARGSATPDLMHFDLGGERGRLAPQPWAGGGTAGPVSAVTGPYASLITAAAKKYGVDPVLISRMMGAESTGQNGLTSPKGAAGLMQLMPDTAKALGVTNPMDPAQNIDAGTRYFKQMLDKFGGQTNLALAAYNWGPGNVDAVRARGGGFSMFPSETQAYIQKITNGLGGNASMAAGPGGAPIPAPVEPNPVSVSGGSGVPPVDASGGGAFGGAGIGTGLTPRLQIGQSGPLEAAIAAQADNQKARAAMEGLVPLPGDTATAMKDLPAIFGEQNPAIQAASGVMQQLFAKPKLADRSQQIAYRA